MYNCNDSERENHAKSHCGHLARDAAEVAGHRIHKLNSQRKDAQSARAENHYIGVSVDRNYCSNGHLFGTEIFRRKLFSSKIHSRRKFFRLKWFSKKNFGALIHFVCIFRRIIITNNLLVF